MTRDSGEFRGAEGSWGCRWNGRLCRDQFRLRAVIMPGGSVAFGELPGGRPVLVTGSADGTVRLWDPATGRPVGSPLVVPGPVRSVAVAATFRGLTVAVGGAGVFAVVIPEGLVLPGRGPGVGGS